MARIFCNILKQLSAALLFAVVAASCAKEIPVNPAAGGSPLSFKASVLEAATRATEAAEDALMENKVTTMHVFLEGNDDAFWKHWSVDVSKQNKADIEKRYLLADNWRSVASDLNGELFLSDSKTYKVYVVANTTLDVSGITSSEDLAALIESETKTASTDELSLYKLYSSTTEDRTHTKNKLFLMDGFDEEWSPDPSVSDQVIDVDLYRAASKIEINFRFDATFLANLAAGGTYITGTPGWRFYNYAFSAPVFNPKDFGATDEATEADVIYASDPLLFSQYKDPDSSDWSFTLTSYTYPNKWAAEDAMEVSPAVILSIGYKTGSNTSYQYYRIPVIDQESVFEIGRNKKYIVNAVISSRGSAAIDDNMPANLNYEVVGWNGEGEGHDEVSHIKERDDVFLQVVPQTYTLRGNGTRSVDIIYSVPLGYEIGLQYFTSQTAAEYEIDKYTGRDTAAYTAGVKAAYYYNQSNSWRTTIQGNNVQSSITVQNNGTGRGTITVSSDALINRAVKYIKFRVYAKVDDWYAKGLYKDVLIKHFPTDNIQNVEGSWSSRWSPAVDYSTSTTDINVAKTWGNYYTQTSAGTYSTITSLSNNQKLTIFSVTDYGGGWYYVGNNWYSDLNAACYAAGYTSAANAVYNDGYYYYVTRSGRTNYTYTFYRAPLTTTYYPYAEETTPSTGKWVDWDRDANQTYSASTAKYTWDGVININGTNRNGLFTAKVYYNGLVYPISVSNQYRYTRSTSQDAAIGYAESTNTRSSNGSAMTGLNNNHMYVIQITATSADYVVGRPTVDPTTHLSQDRVVSPAFMIASQLGAVNSGTLNYYDNPGQQAAIHCSTYMEVAEDGTRYVGWRLPTEEEIKVITGYQEGKFDGVTLNDTNDRTMSIVLSGANYYNLRGTTTSTGISGTGVAVRCIRDLSPEEVEAINNKKSGN